MRAKLKAISSGLIVGIGGGVPTTKADVDLDVLRDSFWEDEPAQTVVGKSENKRIEKVAIKLEHMGVQEIARKSEGFLT
jgi:hypothetical protein